MYPAGPALRTPHLEYVLDHTLLRSLLAVVFSLVQV
jgi:hypothetical protein